MGVIIALPIATPKEYMNTASYAFGHFENCGFRFCSSQTHVFIRNLLVSSWPSGFAFVLSFLSPLWTIGKATFSVL